jgi:septal ring factor EnvC (AmiA/AmiB activator)
VARRNDGAAALWAWLAGSVLVLLLMASGWWLWHLTRELDEVRSTQAQSGDRCQRIESRLQLLERRLDDHDTRAHELAQRLQAVESGLQALAHERGEGTPTR